MGDILQINPYFRPSASECLQNIGFEKLVQDNKPKLAE